VVFFQSKPVTHRGTHYWRGQFDRRILHIRIIGLSIRPFFLNEIVYTVVYTVVQVIVDDAMCPFCAEVTKRQVSFEASVSCLIENKHLIRK